MAVRIKLYILAINSHADCLKFSIFHCENLEVAVSGIVEKIGQPGSFLSIEERVPQRRMIMKNFPDGINDLADALEVVLHQLSHWHPKIMACCNKVIYGGTEFIDPIFVTQSILKKLEPLNNSESIACANVCKKSLPRAKQILTFDSAFYKDVAAHIKELNVCHYGLIHQHALENALAKIKKPFKKSRIITCYLDSEISIAAIKFGRVIDASTSVMPQCQAYTYSIVSEIGKCVMNMGGLDYIIFSGEVIRKNPNIKIGIMKEVRKLLPKVKLITVEVDEELTIAKNAQKII